MRSSSSLDGLFGHDPEGELIRPVKSLNLSFSPLASRFSLLSPSSSSPPSSELLPPTSPFYFYRSSHIPFRRSIRQNVSLLSRLQCPLHPLHSLHSQHSTAHPHLLFTTSLPIIPPYKLTISRHRLFPTQSNSIPNPKPRCHWRVISTIILFAFSSYSSSSSSSSLSSFSVTFQASPSNLKSSLIAPFIRLHVFTSSLADSSSSIEFSIAR